MRYLRSTSVPAHYVAVTQDACPNVCEEPESNMKSMPPRCFLVSLRMSSKCPESKLTSQTANVLVDDAIPDSSNVLKIESFFTISVTKGHTINLNLRENNNNVPCLY